MFTSRGSLQSSNRGYDLSLSSFPPVNNSTLSNHKISDLNYPAEAMIESLNAENISLKESLLKKAQREIILQQKLNEAAEQLRSITSYGHISNDKATLSASLSSIPQQSDSNNIKEQLREVSRMNNELRKYQNENESLRTALVQLQSAVKLYEEKEQTMLSHKRCAVDGLTNLFNAVNEKLVSVCSEIMPSFKPNIAQPAPVTFFSDVVKEDSIAKILSSFLGESFPLLSQFRYRIGELLLVVEAMKDSSTLIRQRIANDKNTLEMKLKRANTDLDELRLKLNNVASIHAKCSTQSEELSKALDSVEVEKKQLKNKCDELQNELKTVRETLRITSEKNAELNSKLSQTVTQNTQLTSDNATKKADIERLKAELREQKEENKRMHEVTQNFMNSVRKSDNINRRGTAMNNMKGSSNGVDKTADSTISSPSSSRVENDNEHDGNANAYFSDYELTESVLSNNNNTTSGNNISTGSDIARNIGNFEDHSPYSSTNNKLSSGINANSKIELTENDLVNLAADNKMTAEALAYELYKNKSRVIN